MSRWICVPILSIAWMQTVSAVEAATPSVPASIEQLMQDRDYLKAVPAIDQAIEKKQGDADYLAYLKGRAFHLAEQYDQAIAAYEQMQKDHPESPWARRARFAAGLSHARKGQFREAELIYRAEAEYLLSLNRKQEIADIYLEFAASYFKPPKDTEQPDYNKAREFYQRALEVGPKPETRIEIELKIAECFQNLEDNGSAIDHYETFLREHAGHALAIEARYQLGHVQLNNGDPEAARRTWQDLLALHAGSESPRMAEATYHLADTYSLPHPDDDEQLNLGVAALRSFLSKYPDHKLAGEANLKIVQSQFNRGRFDDAVKSARQFLADERNEASEQTPPIRVLLGFAYKMQGQFDDALSAWREFLGKHPTHASWSNVQSEIVNTEYLKALAAFRDEKYDDAKKLWSEFLTKYPLDGRNAAILYRFGQMQYAAEQWDEAITEWRRLVSKYPGSNEASHAQFMIAATLEEKIGKLEEALAEFRKVTGTYQSQAAARVARLTSKALAIATERVFRTDETPQIKLNTRNIESVTVAVYSVDLETYFRKMHLASGIEQLDTALIDPDVSFTFTIPKYEQYQQFENTIDVPLPGAAAPDAAGVMVVTVSNETCEATTLVLRSDLDIVVKSSRDEAFVFAENLRTGKPWPAARLLLSNGQQVFAEGTTNDDGVFQKTFDELKSADDVRVFAIADGSTASNVVGLSGVGVARGLSRKGFLYTDRPAYRPGQMVFVRGVIRDVDKDTYKVPSGRNYRLEIHDVRDRLIHEAEVTLNEFGSFHANFLLGEGAPQGNYRFDLKAGDRESYQGTFVVQDYQLEPVYLEIDAERSVYYRGEEITGTIRASYYYGAPLVGRDVTYRLADGRNFTAATDDRGEVHFALPTREFRESQAINLAASIPTQNLSTVRTFLLSTVGFSLSLETPRSTYLAGESFEVTAKAIDAEGEPIEQPLTLTVLRRTKVGNKVGETSVGEFKLTTDKNGIARQTLTQGDGGEYVLRVEGTDRFENPISHDMSLHISDDKDSVRLRILSDRHTYRVGDSAEVTLHWRERPALALVTFEGARILDHRLVPLKTGANKLQLPMSTNLAPNFELAVSVMTDDVESINDQPPSRFHAASSPFTVERELHVTIDVRAKGDAKKTLEPADEVEAIVTAVDAQGKPVAAELSLAMVEQSLLKRYPTAAGSIDAFFRGAMRETAMRTTSSVTFAYTPQTKEIDTHLLAERVRREIADSESRRLAELAGAVDGDAAVALDDLFAAPTDGSVAAAGDEFMEPFGAMPSQPAFESASDYSTWSAPGTAGGGYPGYGNMRGMGGYGMGGGFGGPGGMQMQNGQADFGAMQQMESNLGLQMQSYAPAALEQAVAQTWGAVAQRRFRREQISGLSDAEWDGQVRLPNTARFDLNADNYLNLGKALAITNEVQAVQANGTWFNVNLAKGKGPAVESYVKQLADEGAVLLPGLRQHETGYWNPSITTDVDGRATVEFTLPERSTGWSMRAVGVTTDTLAGEATKEFTVRKQLFGQLKLPAALTDGDSARIEATVHNDALDTGKVEVSLKITIGERTVTQRKTVDVQKKGIHELSFDVEVALPKDAAGQPGGTAEFELTVVGGEHRDVVTRGVPIRPYGLPVYSIAGGSAESDVLAVVEPPKDMQLGSPRLQVIIGPSVERSLLDAVLAPPVWCQVEMSFISSGIESTISDLMAAIALQKLLGGSRDADNPQAELLDARIRSAISSLVSTQLDDGGWSWTGTGRTANNASHRYMTARVVWALSLAREAGYRVDETAFESSLNYLRTSLTQAGVSDYETKSVLLHALSAADRGDFTLANQLYRNRQSLSAAGLAYLALSFAEMDRLQTAGELLAMVGEKNFDTAAGLAWLSPPAEVRAIYALGLEMVSPADARLREQIDWLMSHRTGARWSPDRATGPAMLAACRWFARTRFQGDSYKLTVFVNDLQAGELTIDAKSLTQTIDVPAELLKDGKQAVRITLTGRGRYTYQAVLGGFVPGDQLKRTTPDWDVSRTIEPAPLEMDGVEIPRGFDLVRGNYNFFRNDLTQLPVGRRGQVTLRVIRHNTPANANEANLSYLVVTEQFPAGVSVVENSIRGGFERYELGPGTITFYVGSRRYVDTIHYDVHGYLPGQYRNVPTVVRDTYRPDQMAVAEPKSLDVLAENEASRDTYRLTPRELYELGTRQFDKGNLAEAGVHLTTLLKDWNIDDSPYRESVRMLLDVHLKNGPAADVVRYFEIIIEKYPDLEIPFGKLVKVADAYHEIAEYERSYLVFRATIEASFLRESQIGGFLESQSEFLRSVDVMSNLLRQYPPEPYLATAEYALAQRIFAKGLEAASDPKLREKKITRVDLVQQVRQRLDAFLTSYPNDPAADQASFSLANAMLEIELYAPTIQRCERFAERYPTSDYLDSYWYIIGFCHFALGQHQQALDMCRKVAETQPVDPTTSQPRESTNKWRAIYILGQIHHSLGEAAKAIAEYRRVDDRFVDARQAIDYFLHKQLELPEVKTFRPEDAVELELKFRNIPDVETTVYRIDLLKFSLLRRDLSDITNINLAGIRPYHQSTLKLGNGLDYRDRTSPLKLPLKEEGAYLVVCRGENLYTSSMVLVSPLELEIQEEQESGRVRTTVRNAVDQKYLHDVLVKVIGSRNDEFVSGETDLRGIFIADAIQGRSMVIAQAGDGRYAFHRGQQDLGPHPQSEAAPNQQAAEPAAPQGKLQGGKGELLEGLQMENYKALQEQQLNLDNFYNNDVKAGIGGGFGGGIF